MTLIVLSATDLTNLQNGQFIERTGGPSIRIVYGPARKIDVVKVLVGGEEP